jgi:transcription-repair coupling factor (superfamily II helicase)
VLTLTATPIPRTLQLALSGVRELSLITTPPLDRLAVRTFISPFDPVIIREHLLRELYRGGQSFFVVPRIADLPNMEEWLREQVPEVKAVTAHGQMSATQVEERMRLAARAHVLLATIVNQARHSERQHAIVTAPTCSGWRSYQLRGGRTVEAAGYGR